MKKTLVVDIGGTHVKLMMQRKKRREFDSGSRMSPKNFVKRLKANTRDWKYHQISIGFPAPIRDGKVIRNPKHLGKGWLDFNFRKALGKPVHVINDAAMQALGSYHGRRMLFLGLGTGLGSALLLENLLFPVELGDLPYRDRDIIENFLGILGIKRLGLKKWKREVIFAVTHLKRSFIADYVVLGGGNVHRLRRLPKGIERGKNENAFLGGLRLWEIDRRSKRKKWKVF